MGMEENLDQFGNYWDSVMKHWVKFTGLYPATPPTIIYQLVNWCRISSIHGSSSSKDKEWSTKWGPIPIDTLSLSPNPKCIPERISWHIERGWWVNPADFGNLWATCGGFINSKWLWLWVKINIYWTIGSWFTSQWLATFARETCKIHLTTPRQWWTSQAHKCIVSSWLLTLLW